MARKKKNDDEEKDAKGPSSARVLMAKAFPTFVKMPQAPTGYKETVKLPKDGKTRLPKVDLLPYSMVLEVQKRKLKRTLLITGVSMFMVMGGLWYTQTAEITLATAQVETSEFELNAVRKEMETLKPIGNYFNQLGKRIETATEFYHQQIDYAGVLEGLQSAAPPGVVITEINITYVDPAGEAEPGCGAAGSPFEEEGPRPAGCVEFFGTSPSTAILSDFILGLESIAFLQSPFVAPGAPGEGGQVSFSGTAAVSTSASFATTAPPLVNIDGLPALGAPVPQEVIPPPVEETPGQEPPSGETPAEGGEASG